MNNKINLITDRWGDTPPPGSKEAVDQGCRCAVWDNHRGRGVGGEGWKYGWYVTEGCPLHTERKNDEDSSVE